MNIYRVLFSFSTFLLFSLTFSISAVADQEVDEVESVEAVAEVSDDDESEDEDVLMSVSYRYGFKNQKN